MNKKDRGIIKEIDGLKKDFIEYLQLKLELTKMQTAQNMSRMIYFVINFFVIFSFALFTLLFLSIAGAYKLGTLLDSIVLGFVIVGGIYLFIIFIFLLIRKKIVEAPIIKNVIKLFFNKNDHYE